MPEGIFTGRFTRNAKQMPIFTDNIAGVLKKSEVIPKECKQRIDRAIHYILKNPNGDLSLGALAAEANYSPFHFQKLFKQVVGETPKQYVIKLRLETAIHLLLIHPYKSVFEIAEECGFSSPAVFSRAFRNYFQLSAEEVRAMPPKEMKFLHDKMQFKFAHDAKAFTGEAGQNQSPAVLVKRLDGMKIVFSITPFGDMEKAKQGLKEVHAIAEANGLLENDHRAGGILNPHQGHVYNPFVSIGKAKVVPGKLFVREISGGNYAIIKVSGAFKNTIEAGKYFFHEWLPESGYRLADNLIFELFLSDARTIPYQKTKREVCIRVVPA